MIVCLNRTSSSWPVLREHQGFCINVLAHDQLHVADRFAGRGGVKGVARYEGAQWQELVTGALALSSALTVIDCELEEAIERHSHAILIGRVRAIRTRETAEAACRFRTPKKLVAPSSNSAPRITTLVITMRPYPVPTAARTPSM